MRHKGKFPFMLGTPCYSSFVTNDVPPSPPSPTGCWLAGEGGILLAVTAHSSRFDETLYCQGFGFSFLTSALHATRSVDTLRLYWPSGRLNFMPRAEWSEGSDSIDKVSFLRAPPPRPAIHSRTFAACQKLCIRKELVLNITNLTLSAFSLSLLWKILLKGTSICCMEILEEINLTHWGRGF